MKTMGSIKKQLAVGMTAALLLLSLGITPALAETAASAGTTTAASTAGSGVNAAATGDDAAAGAASTKAEDQTKAAVAVVDEEGNTVDPANWLTDFIGKLQMALTFDPVGKSQLMERHALKKLAKAQKLMAEGKKDKCQMVFSEYTDKITQAQEFLDSVEDPDSEEAQKLIIALANVNQKNIEVLGNLLDKLPPQAGQKLALNVVRTMEKAVTKLEKEEAQADSAAGTNTVPVTVAPATDSAAAAAEKKELKKQAEQALKEFKKSLQNKKNLHLDFEGKKDKGQNQDKVKTVSAPSTALNTRQQVPVTVAPASPQPISAIHAGYDKAERQKQDKKHEVKGKTDNKKAENKQQDKNRGK